MRTSQISQAIQVLTKWTASLQLLTSVHEFMFMNFFVCFFLDAATIETRILMKQESISVNFKKIIRKTQPNEVFNIT